MIPGVPVRKIALPARAGRVRRVASRAFKMGHLAPQPHHLGLERSHLIVLIHALPPVGAPLMPPSA
jgi:hypothetical protein